MSLFPWAGAVGMVAVPNLSGQSYTTAITTLQNAGLNYTNSGSTDTSNSNLNTLIATQSIAAGTLVDYGTSVSFTYYNYVSGGGGGGCTAGYLGDWTYADPASWSTCSGGSQSGTSTSRTGTYRNSDCSTQSVTQSGSWTVTRSCSSPTCTAGALGDWTYAAPASWGTCTNGSQSGTSTSRTGSYRNTDCSITTITETGSWTVTQTCVSNAANWVASYSEYRASCCGVVTIYVDSNPLSPTYNTEKWNPCSNGWTYGTTCPAPFSVFGFSPFGFSPFSVFGFSPFSVFGFSPFAPYSFSTTTYGVKCISGNTFIRISSGSGIAHTDHETGKITLKDSSGNIVAKQAKDIQIGDEVLSVSYSEIDPSQPDYEVFAWNSDTLTFIENTTTTIVDIEESLKIQTICFNNDTSAQFTLEHPILVKKTIDGQDQWKFAMVAELEIGDTIVKFNNTTGQYDNVIISTIDIITNENPVYTFSAEPFDIIIAGDVVTHNK
jgi:hypothetical protein